MEFMLCMILFCMATGTLARIASEPELQSGDVTFDLVTRDHLQPIPISSSNASIVKNKPTIININGWMHNTTAPTSYFPNITREYLIKGDYNIILVHADRLMFYSEAVSVTYTNAIGNFVGDLIASLYQRAGVFLEFIHIVGHALGSHIAGAAGRRVNQRLSASIYRITALEVSKLGFENVSASRRLDSSDAVVVDVIHTAAGEVGLNQSVGSADFWPNGGTVPQPGCDPQSQLGKYCSHDRSIWYFVYTIRSFPLAVRCNSYEAFQNHRCRRNPEVIFGDNYQGKVGGNFYLNLVCDDDRCKSTIE